MRADEFGQVGLETVAVAILAACGRHFLDGLVHAVDLTIRPRLLGSSCEMFHSKRSGADAYSNACALQDMVFPNTTLMGSLDLRGVLALCRSLFGPGDAQIDAAGTVRPVRLDA